MNAKDQPQHIVDMYLPVSIYEDWQDSWSSVNHNNMRIEHEAVESTWYMICWFGCGDVFGEAGGHFDPFRCTGEDEWMVHA